ncbi:MAG: hypothetical protein J0I77_12615 [Rudaea sp.]|uniref:DUF6600 domain-containing protein n=1 Tax=unclassified Rudaea TaxID=2627037 RepID=UPI0010F5C020|nr:MULTISPECIES: DUF6600 domain-containing protein [unclassified Rudaea]MBN8886558.1 hypothetical protein [Rudaea sp.]
MTMFKPVAVLLAGLLFAGTGFAQPPPDYSSDDPGSYNDASGTAIDPPSRVARLSVIRGAVSFVPAGENNWVQAEVNRPLISGDKLWTDRGARAELQIGSSAIRVDEQSNFHFLNLDDNMAQIELTEGTINLRVRRIYDGQTYEVDTPTLAFVINRVGEYRIDVAPDGRGTIVTAFRGGGDAYGEAGARFRIEEGQSIRFNDAQLRDYVSNGVPSPDDFDRFCFDRDGRWDNSRSRQYVSEDIIGYDDLDSYGSWDSTPDYGNVWYPSQVAVGWTPYSYGRWSWVGAYGWTWVDSSPWGFAPFHYGRWAWVNNRWGWCPGPANVRPYYAPALVAFVSGGGARLAFNVGGPVGWFPLGPRDVYVPSYRVSRNYFTSINIHNTTINNVTINNFYGNYQRGNFDYSRVNYANRNVTNAITAVRGDVFTGSREVRGSVVAVNRETFANARVSGFAAIAPTRQSLAFDAGGRSAAAPPQAVQSRSIIAATRPPAPMASFAQRENALQRDPGRALPVAQLRAAPTVIGNGEAAQRAAMTSRPNVNVVTRDGAPARSIAPSIQPRGPAQADGRAVDMRQSNDNARAGADNRSIDTRRAIDNNSRAPNDQAQRGQQPQGNPVQGRSITVPPGGHPQPEEQRGLPSSRYVNPNAPDNSAQQRSLRGNDNAGQRDNTPQNRSVPIERQPQQDNRSAVQMQQRQTPEYRSAPVERAPQVDMQQRAQQQQEMQQRRQQEVDQQRQQSQQREIQQRAQQQQEFQQRQQQESQQRAQQQQEMQQRAQQQRDMQQQRAQQQQEMQQRAQQQQEVQQRAQQQREMQQQQMQQRAQQQQEMQQRAQQQREVQQQQFQQRAQQQQEMQQRAQQQQRSEPQQRSEQPRSRGDNNNDRNNHR